MSGACKTCAHKHQPVPNGPMECRRNPPSLVVVAVQNPISREIMQQVTALFPGVGPDAWCGEWKADHLTLI